ncbi:Glutamate decarboxylase 2 [Yamadazyma tenuis]|uniref:PLP-dependent transferase n=1 Tax=Candida tenuis (strain ATCC 10573 / BCRC 21748 / CBS 615 / JCM 9827 / NBRC 10315 / NRRL Y-1498 / VKM Y-70) TaxID=590646 RepID=G3B576_CANTC|nr:uncharacterized protein CANTEDRAFT_123007 [Yamadazyma tenuis ATCC 10573]EGV63155.1 hypothetical protein CANTEDRAFT_123007 [Yamadazyma tenuis ATCC 10573]WEJ97026.1 Glutamate decarboxylase 2 [Yamadazyma tenuis]
MSLQTPLETNRATELDRLLALVTPKILQHIEESDPSSSNFKQNALGQYRSPAEVKSHFAQFNSDFEPIKNDEQKLQHLINSVLDVSVNTWNPGFLDKLYASNNPIGVISDLILSVLNTNSHVFTVSPVLSVLENYVAREYGRLFFKDHQDTCGGLTFSGGSWSNITSLQMARALLYPDTKIQGNGSHRFAVYTSKHCHYSVEKAAILLGLGSGSVFKVAVNDDGTMHHESLEAAITDSIAQGFTPLYINATAGTTVFGSFDAFAPISRIAQKYRVWFHIDGSWGGNVVFSRRHRHRLDGCHTADSITVNPHKMLGVPTTCSFLLVPHVGKFQQAMSLDAPYLFHGRESDEENFDLADGTMGCGRRADSFKLYMAWKYYGTRGFEQRVDHAYDTVRYFLQATRQHPNFAVVGDPACLQVCFYYRPKSYEGDDLTPVTRYISRELHTQGRYLVDFSPHPQAGAQDEQGEFFRVVFNSPILTDAIIDDLVTAIVKAGEAFERDQRKI